VAQNELHAQYRVEWFRNVEIYCNTYGQVITPSGSVRVFLGKAESPKNGDENSCARHMHMHTIAIIILSVYMMIGYLLI
jgi:hypothetical protein